MANPPSEGMVAIVTGLQDAGLSVTVTDGRSNGQRRSVDNAVRYSHPMSQGLMATVSSGVQTSSPPERARSATQVMRPSSYLSTYQRSFGSHGGSPSPPTSPVRAPHDLDIQRLNAELDQLRASLCRNGPTTSTPNRPHPPTPMSPVYSPNPGHSACVPTPNHQHPSPSYSCNSPVNAGPNTCVQNRGQPISPVYSPNSPVHTGQNTYMPNRAHAPLSPAHSPSAPLHPPCPAELPTRLRAPVRDVNFHMYRNTSHLDRLKGSSSSGCRRDRDLRISDAFAESLRKYPSSADRTASVDIIQRLLAFTQSKNGAKKTYHTKRVRSLTRHSREAINAHMRSSNKNIQTYVRTINDSPYAVASCYGKPERRHRVISPAKSERSEGSPSGAETMSYDYLKIGSFSPRTTDVRYLNDVTRYVKDTLRVVCNNDEVLCPQMLDRYSAHRREHHQAEAGTLTVKELDQFAQSNYYYSYL